MAIKTNIFCNSNKYSVAICASSNDREAGEQCSGNTCPSWQITPASDDGGNNIFSGKKITLAFKGCNEKSGVFKNRLGRLNTCRSIKSQWQVPLECFLFWMQSNYNCSTSAKSSQEEMKQELRWFSQNHPLKFLKEPPCWFSAGYPLWSSTISCSRKFYKYMMLLEFT